MITRMPVSSASATALWILAVLGTVFFLRAARQLLIPIALAVLISYALEPVVVWLERHRLPRMAGAGLTLLIILALGAGGVYALKDDAIQAVQALPKATEQARDVVLAQLGAGSESINEAIKQLGAGATGSGSADAKRARALSFSRAPSVETRGNQRQEHGRHLRVARD